ncbi:O-acetylhomoserine aminocarboxypropyltransferase/cysteine synthase [bacterium]|nr:O-acetylhomoserine aminocarboxypropyltransferase/cysteine synthase [bacterium]
MAGWSFSTKAIHAGVTRDASTGATSVPIYQTASYSYPTAEALADVFAGRKYGHVYSRISNPTVSALESRYTELEGGIGSVALASGMAAIAAALESLCESGDHIVASNGLFGGTLHLLKDVFSRRGISTTFVDLSDTVGFRSAIASNTKAVLVEVIGNPKLDVADIKTLSSIAHHHGIPLVLDNTLTTPVILDAKQWGVDIIVNCLGKFVAGNGNTIGGILVDTGNFDWTTTKSPLIKEFSARFGKFAFVATTRKRVAVNTGACMAPLSAYLFLMGLESLSLRVERHCDNALALALFFQNHPNIQSVRYPGLPDHSHRGLVDAQFGGNGGALLTIRLGSKERAYQVINALKIVSNAANLGDAKTLCIHVASTIYRDFSVTEQEAAGVFDDLIRISVGIEGINDIISDFDQALSVLNKGV